MTTTAIAVPPSGPSPAGSQPPAGGTAATADPTRPPMLELDCIRRANLRKVLEEHGGDMMGPLTWIKELKQTDGRPSRKVIHLGVCADTDGAPR